MITWTVYITLGLADAFLFFGLVLSTLYLRRKHPGHVFTIGTRFG
jgi:hypothetical protein